MNNRDFEKICNLLPAGYTWGCSLTPDVALYIVNAALASQAQQPSNELKEMESRKDAAYLERNQVVAALAKCFPSGTAKTAIEGWSEDWHGCVYIDLPTGQASWHYHDSQAYLFADLPAYKGKWDGHTTEEKYSRIAKLQSQAQQTNSEPQEFVRYRHSKSDTVWFYQHTKFELPKWAIDVEPYIPPAPEGEKP